MAKYRVTGPDGATYEVNAPDGASDQDVMAFVQSQHAAPSSPPDFAAQAAGMAPIDVSIARAKDGPFGDYLRAQALQPQQGETPDQMFKRQYGGLSQEARPNSGEGVARSVLQGATFGGGDELVAAGAAALDPLLKGSGGSYGDRYDAYLGRERGRLGEFRNDHPVAAIGSEVAGAIPTSMMLPALRAAEGASLAGRALIGGANAAGQGAAYGFNSGEGGVLNRAENAGTSALIAGAVGAAAPYVGNAVQKAGKSAAESKIAKAFLKDAPDTEALRRLGSDAFKRAEAAGVVVKPDAIGAQVDDIAAWAAKEGIDPTLHPGATAALKRLQDVVDDPQSLDKIQTLRRVLGSAAQSQSADERRIASGMISQLDDFVSSLTPEQTLAGNVGTVADDLTNARDFWSRMKKSEMIDNAFTKADMQASGVENGLRIQFRQLLNNAKTRRNFSPEEIAAMEKVVKGDFTTNTLRRLGKLSAGTGQQSNMLNTLTGTGLGAGVGAAVGGPVGAAIGASAVQGLGYGSQKAAEALTRRQASLAQALMASGAGGTVADNPQLGRLTQMLLQRGAPLSAPIRENVR
jgi:hypothetical protein